MQGIPSPRSLVWSTEIDVLAIDHELQRRDGYWVIRSPRNPQFYWGNFLLFDRPPALGDRVRWEAIFAAEFDAAHRHRSFGWDSVDGALGAAPSEFADRYELDASVGLIAGPDGLRRLESENRDLDVVLLGGDSPEWEGVAALWLDQNAHDADPHPAPAHETYVRDRVRELAELIGAGRGVWAVALDTGQVVGSLGVIVRGGRARFQNVDTRASHRRRGIAARLLLDAAEAARGLGAVEHFVILADPDYHAIGLYERVGFRALERITQVTRRPER